jgi:hypothetical protein
MKKQNSDQQFHDRRHQERKRAEAAKNPPPKKPAGAPVPADEAADGGTLKPANAVKR